MVASWRKYASVLLVTILVVGTVFTSSGENYLQADEVPNPIAYLPLPPDSSHIMRNGDFARWIFAKAQRNTPRGDMASEDSRFGIARMCEIYSGVLGVDISVEHTPAIYQLMARSGSTGSSGVARMKNTYFRKRPFLVMHEPVWGQYDSYDNLSTNSSYPSSHTSYAWGTALALAEMVPCLQDTILGRAYDYGISRVIVGAHWQSDVDAAFLCASAAMARAHATQEYAADLAAAREEYLNLKGLTESEIGISTVPAADKILDGPALEDSYHYYSEVAGYWDAKTERDTERGAQAVADADLNDDAIIAGFDACTPFTISTTTTPNITTLIKTAKLMFGLHAMGMKDYWYRNRPYVQLGDPTAVPADEETYRNESSYPSGHAVIGWGLALVLAEVMPDFQDAILKHGYDFGWSRVITGFHYPSDVQAGRVMAACVLAKMHNESYFTSLLQAAKQEYDSIEQDTYEATNLTPRTETVLPLPPDSSSVGFTGDFYRWIYGKSQRDTEIGELARLDSECDIDRLCSIYSGVLNVDIDATTTPAIYHLLGHVAQAGVASCGTMCPTLARKRPFELMNEQPCDENDEQAALADTTTYPSRHAVIVWSTALALAQMAPNLQDTILSRAMDCATSSVITGAHWQSDIDAALICASASLTIERSTTQFDAMMTAARNEYLTLSGLTQDALQAPFPSINKILETPPTVDDVLFADDVETHWRAATLRDTERGVLAAADASLADDYLLSIFDQCQPWVNISEAETPQISMFVKVLKFILSTYITDVKKSHYRARPYVELGEDIPYAGEAWQLYAESSYPSRHAALGWALALALAEVMPDSQQAIIKRGYDYGDSRIIQGMCYSSDVMAARIMATCCLGKLHDESLFKTMLDKAQKEYQSIRNKGDVNGDGAVNSADVTALYDYILNGDSTSIVNGDQDGDGYITSGDVTTVYNIMLGNQ